MGSFSVPVPMPPVAMQTNRAQLVHGPCHISLWDTQILKLGVPQLLFVGLTELQGPGTSGLPLNVLGLQCPLIWLLQMSGLFTDYKAK